jgi:hypothetical protein
LNFFLINVPVKIAPISPECPKKVHTLRYLWPKAGNLNVLDFERHSQEQTLMIGPEPFEIEIIKNNVVRRVMTAALTPELALSWTFKTASTSN